MVSRFHAELRARPDGRHELVDLGSRNGTFVNGRTVDRAILEELDLVSVGHNTFRLVGSGLAELLNALTGFRPASAGRVFYDGRDLYEDYDELPLRLGFVPQGNVLHEALTVGQDAVIRRAASLLP